MAESPLLREADRWVGRYRTLMLKAFTAGMRAVSIARAKAGLEAKNMTAVEHAAASGTAAIETVMKEGMPTLMLNLMAAAGNVAGKELPLPPLATLKSRVAKPLRFDKKNPEAIRWAERHAARLIVEISEESRAAVRHVIVTGLSDGVAPAAQAQLIRQSVGLTEQYAAAVAKLHKRLSESPGKLIRAGKLTFRVPEGGMSAADRNKAIAKYTDRLVKSRALNIARTETITASNEGQYQLWKQAKAKGLLGNDVRREWIATQGACPECTELDGEVTGLDTTFSGGVHMPPAHPGCRCTTGLTYV